jgi:hypothetical protein
MQSISRSLTKGDSQFRSLVRICLSKTDKVGRNGKGREKYLLHFTCKRWE